MYSLYLYYNNTIYIKLVQLLIIRVNFNEFILYKLKRKCKRSNRKETNTIAEKPVYKPSIYSVCTPYKVAVHTKWYINTPLVRFNEVLLLFFLR